MCAVLVAVLCVIAPFARPGRTGFGPRIRTVITMAVLVSVLGGMSVHRIQAQTTVSDTVTLVFEELGGIALLGITDAAVHLVAYETGSAMFPGAQYQTDITAGEANGGRLHYTVHGQGDTMKISVESLTAIPPNALTVCIVDFGTVGGDGNRGTVVAGEIAVGAEPHDLLTGIGDCYTGTGDLDGPLVFYRLVDNPGFGMGDVVLRYTLVAE